VEEKESAFKSLTGEDGGEGITWADFMQSIEGFLPPDRASLTVEEKISQRFVESKETKEEVEAIISQVNSPKPNAYK